MLGRHDGLDGRAYRRAWSALVQEFGDPPLVSLRRLEMGRVALAWARFETASRVLADAKRARRKGLGRRPSSSEIERLSRRVGLEDSTYASALDTLRALVGEQRKPPLDLARAIQQAQQDAGR